MARNQLEKQLSSTSDSYKKEQAEPEETELHRPEVTCFLNVLFHSRSVKIAPNRLLPYEKYNPSN